jgi:AraC-like DNA-binding protein
MAVPATTRVLFESGGLELGEFRCAPGHPYWREVNDNIGGWPHVVFPRTTVYIDRRPGDPRLATPNDVVFYGSHERYRRALHDPRGDRSVFVAVQPDVFEAIAGRTRPPASQRPSDARLYLAVELLVRGVSARANGDELGVEEALLALVAAALAGAPGPRRPPARVRTRAAHRELAEEAKARLAHRLADPVTLAALAAELHTSAYHLARVFRAHTGFGVHDYRIHLRLRASLERLHDRSSDLTRIGLDLGFCSLSHFSGSFSRVFGVPPSAVRAGSAPELGELRTIVEARLAARS